MRVSRTTRAVLALAASAAFIALATQSCRPGGDIVIGFAASMSGMDYMLGVDGRNAAMLFLDEVNASGGIAGRKVRMEIRDLASDDGMAARMGLELVDAGACAVVGYYTSTGALASLSAFQEVRVPVVSPTSTSNDLSGKADYFFRTIMTSARDPEVLGSIMAENGQSRVLFIAAAYNKPYYLTYRAGLSSRVRISGEIYYNLLGEIDYDAITAISEAPGYDGVMIVASSLDTGTIAQELAVRGLGKSLYLSGWAGNEELITYGGAAVEGAILVHQVDAAASSGSALSERYRRVFGAEPSYGAIETWDSMFFLMEGLRRCGGNPRKLYDALLDIREFQGTAGPIAMDEYGDAIRPLYIKRVLGGKFVVTGTAD